MKTFKDELREKLLSGIKVIFDKDNTEKSGCWEWQKSMTTTGYGQFAIYRRRYRAHNVSAYIYGILDSLDNVEAGIRMVLHKCNNRKCVNPYHLYIGNQKDNVEDAMKAGTFLHHGQVIFRRAYGRGQ